MCCRHSQPSWVCHRRVIREHVLQFVRGERQGKHRRGPVVRSLPHHPYNGRTRTKLPRPTPHCRVSSATYLDLVPPVPLIASGDKMFPFDSATGDPAGSMPADSHLFQIFFECRGSTPPCLFRPSTLSSAVFWSLMHCCSGVSFYNMQAEDVASHSSPFSSNFVRSLHAALPITSSFVARSSLAMPRNVKVISL